MKHKSRFIFRIICFFMMLIVVASVSVTGIQADDRNCELIISCCNEEKPLEGLLLNIYRIGDFDEKDNITLLGHFEGYKIDVTTEDRPALAQTLYGYALLDKINPEYSVKSDDNGNALISHIEKGVYMITGECRADDDIYISEPQLVFLPWHENRGDEWTYSKNIVVKCKKLLPDNTVTVKALKKWNDSGNENNRPQSIEVVLLQDGQIYEIVQLTKENNWRHTWKSMASNSVWTVVERIPDNYTVLQQQEGITRVITNSCEDTPPTTGVFYSSENEKLPQTGMLWWPVPVLFIIGTGLVIIGLIKRKGDNFEA